MQDIIRRAALIKLLILDVDGILSDGKIYMTESGSELKTFHVHDGLGMKLLQKTGVTVGVITSRKSPIVTERMLQLNVTHVYQGQQEKMPAYIELKNKLQLSDEQIAYMGDDLPDLPLILRAGLGITVANATSAVKQYADWITIAEGGNGAVREACELIMQAQNTYIPLLQPYLHYADA